MMGLDVSTMHMNIKLLLLIISLAASLFAQPTQLPVCRVGLHVPLVSPSNNSATILAFDEAKGSYQVKSDKDAMTDWVPARSLRYSCVGVEARPVSETYFIGAWTLFVGPTAHHEIIDSKGYLVVGQGAHVPPIIIRANGTYTWTIDSKTVIEGKWRGMTASELRSGTKAPAILLMNGESGKNWQVSKAGVSAGDNRDTISIDRMDLGLSYQGTRLP